MVRLQFSRGSASIAFLGMVAFLVVLSVVLVSGIGYAPASYNTGGDNSAPSESGSSQIIITQPVPSGKENLQLRTFTVISPTPAPTAMSLVACDTTRDIPEYESEVLRAYAPQIAGPTDTLKVWFTDEYTPQLGVSKITVNGPTAETRTFPVSLMTSSTPQSANPVQSGAGYGNEPDMKWRGTDTYGRPIFPAIFLTDITTNPTDISGDWEVALNNAKPIQPHAIFGTWKVTEKLIDAAGNATMQVGANAAVGNGWNLGPGSDPVPAEAGNPLKYGTEARWNVSQLIAEGHMQAGHTYRVEFMVHDGDSTRTGGDVDEACGTVRLP